MADVTLAAEVGRPLGSRATRRLRREGKIPGVIYGHGTDPVAVAVEARVAVAHGQMDEGTLESVVLDFWARRYDVLVCTTCLLYTSRCV